MPTALGVIAALPRGVPPCAPFSGMALPFLPHRDVQPHGCLSVLNLQDTRGTFSRQHPEPSPPAPAQAARGGGSGSGGPQSAAGTQAAVRKGPTWGPVGPEPVLGTKVKADNRAGARGPGTSHPCRCLLGHSQATRAPLRALPGHTHRTVLCLLDPEPQDPFRQQLQGGPQALQGRAHSIRCPSAWEGRRL